VFHLAKSANFLNFERGIAKRVLKLTRNKFPPLFLHGDNMMKLMTWILLSGALTASAAQANDSFNAELSHFVGNTFIASTTTIITDKYWPEVEHPAWTGFAVSTSEAFIGEFADYALGGDFSLLDAVVGTMGAAVGAYATDKWYVAPRVNTKNGDSTYGLVVVYRF
jgi:hypothetical protein